MLDKLKFAVSTWLCGEGHRTVINEGDKHICMYCGWEMPEGFHTEYAVAS